MSSNAMDAQARAERVVRCGWCGAAGVAWLVRPWIVTAQANLRGSCRREHWPPDANQVRRIGVMGTVPSDSVGPV